MVLSRGFVGSDLDQKWSKSIISIDKLWLDARQEVSVYIFCLTMNMLGGRIVPFVGGVLVTHAKFGIELGSSGRFGCHGGKCAFK